jgi:hypothetical protein
LNALEGRGEERKLWIASETWGGEIGIQEEKIQKSQQEQPHNEQEQWSLEARRGRGGGGEGDESGGGGTGVPCSVWRPPGSGTWVWVDLEKSGESSECWAPCLSRSPLSWDDNGTLWTSFSTSLPLQSSVEKFLERNGSLHQLSSGSLSCGRGEEVRGQRIQERVEGGGGGGVAHICLDISVNLVMKVMLAWDISWNSAFNFSFSKWRDSDFFSARNLSPSRAMGWGRPTGEEGGGGDVPSVFEEIISLHEILIGSRHLTELTISVLQLLSDREFIPRHLRSAFPWDGHPQRREGGRGGKGSQFLL